MGIFRPLVKKSMGIAPRDVELSDKILTPATAFTLSRPELARRAAGKLLRGEKRVTPWAIAAGLTDMEGIPARLTDKYWPKSGRGSTRLGAELDPIADTAAILILCSAGLVAPRMPKTGKVAIAAALGTEGLKAAWAFQKNVEYQPLAGTLLHIATTLNGKEAMAEKLCAIGLAIMASDCDSPFARNVLGSGAIAMAVTGSVRGEHERRMHYVPAAEDMIAVARTARDALPEIDLPEAA